MTAPPSAPLAMAIAISSPLVWWGSPALDMARISRALSAPACPALIPAPSRAPSAARTGVPAVRPIGMPRTSIVPVAMPAAVPTANRAATSDGATLAMTARRASRSDLPAASASEYTGDPRISSGVALATSSSKWL